MGQSSSSSSSSGGRRRDDRYRFPHPTPPPPPPTRPYNSFYPQYPAAASPYSVQPPPPRPPPAPFVEHERAKTVKNSVNVHKDTIRLQPDGTDPDRHLVSFTFDALTDGSITIYYFAKEGRNCTFYPIYADIYVPTKVPFQKGLSQKFQQPSGSGVDLGFFELDELSRPLHGDVFPLVIYAEACPLEKLKDELVDQSATGTHAQITQAVIMKHSGGSILVKVFKQILWVNGERYELQEIFGLDNSAESDFGGADLMGKECVICLTEQRDTAVFPCRHLCMCSECAKALRLQSNTCPICRQPIEKLMEIKVNNADC